MLLQMPGLLLIRRYGQICWRVKAVCKHVDVLRWFREFGVTRFPSIAALARVWLGRAPSDAFQERVFLDGRCRDDQFEDQNGQPPRRDAGASEAQIKLMEAQAE
ncbi:unnamed protein product [Phytophthora lilii]|uniref:Unnamed protein product n=1 Tax=Phytophthora lilii TaxID=2077276 RepID=A0A9W6WR10_9STRA|nr:unnamed protein product [Phytophthora lilii]